MKEKTVILWITANKFYKWGRQMIISVWIIIIYLCHIVFKLMNVLAQYMENNRELLYSNCRYEYRSWVQCTLYIVTTIIVWHFVARHSLSTQNKMFGFLSRLLVKRKTTSHHTPNINSFNVFFFFVKLWRRIFFSGFCAMKKAYLGVRVFVLTRRHEKKKYYLIIEFWLL